MEYGIEIKMNSQEWKSIVNILKCYECTPILNKFMDQVDEYFKNNQPERSKREDFGFYGKPIIDSLFDENGNLSKDAVL
jgi:hypothetical protein